MSTRSIWMALCALVAVGALASVVTACGDDDDDTTAGDGDADADGDGDGDGDGDADGDGDGDADCGADTTSDDPEFGPLLEAMKAVRAEYAVPGMAFAVVRGGEVTEGLLGTRLRGQCDEPIDADTLFRGTAGFAELFAAIGVHQAGLDLQASVHDTWLPDLEVASGDATAITLGQLLTWSAGIPWWDDGLCVSPDNELCMTPTLDDLLVDLQGKSLRSAPGRLFSWSGWSTALAGKALADSREESYEDAIRALVFDPLDLDATFSLADAQAWEGGYAWSHWHGTPTEVVPDNEGAYPVEQVYLSLHDAEKLATWLLGEGSAFVDAARTNAAEMARRSTNERASHGLFFRSDGTGGTETVEAGAVFRGYISELVLVPEDDLAFVLLMNVGDEAAPSSGPVLDAVMTMAGHFPYTPYDHSVPEDRWGEYAGTYVDPNAADGPSTVEVTFDEATHELTLSIDPGTGTVQGPFSLSAAGPVVLAAPGSLEPDVFTLDDHEAVVWLYVYRDDADPPMPEVVDFISGWGFASGNPYYRVADGGN